MTVQISHDGEACRLQWNGEELVPALDSTGVAGVLRLRIDGSSDTVQVDRVVGGYDLSHRGVRRTLRVYSPRAAALNRHMLEKKGQDTSNFLLSPMPGLLIHVAVSAGQEVKAGEELAVIEAMKMENVMRAERDVVISRVCADVGESLAVDQAIIEFA